MEFEKMGFDMTGLVLVIMGNGILVAIGTCLVVYLERIIKRWEKRQAHRLHPHIDFTDFEASKNELPINYENYQESYQSGRSSDMPHTSI